LLRRSQHAGTPDLIRNRLNPVLLAAGGVREPLGVERSLVYRARLNIGPRLLGSVSHVDDTTVHDVVGRWVFPQLPQGIAVERNLTLAEIASERQIQLRAALDRRGRHSAPEQFWMRLADRAGKDADVVELKILAREAEALAGPGAFQDFDRFERPAETLLARYLETVELLAAIP